MCRGDQFSSYFDQSLNQKFLSHNLGPFLITHLDDQNHATLQITPSKTKSFHLDLLMPYLGEEIPFKPGYFTPQLGEIITIPLPSPRKPLDDERLLPESAKKIFNVKSIVGRRIYVLWNSNKKYYKALVIGYTANLEFNLIAFDEPTIDKVSNLVVDPREDYYKVKLFKDQDKVRSEKWSLLESKK